VWLLPRRVSKVKIASVRIPTLIDNCFVVLRYSLGIASCISLVKPIATTWEKVPSAKEVSSAYMDVPNALKAVHIESNVCDETTGNCGLI
jgi:hypothetical protein